jgi:hypothetical protein
MENTMHSVGATPAHDQSAVRNGSLATSRIKLILVWLAVGLPLIWGAIEAFSDTGNLPL